MHDWSDQSVDWKGINDAARYIYTYLRRWRVPVQDYKEKFGTVRVYTGLHWERGWLLMHLFKPGYHYWAFPKWMRTVDYWIPTHWLNVVLHPFFCWLYRRAYRNALKKWPHLRYEILEGASWGDLLGEFGVHYIRTGPNSYDIMYDWYEGSKPRREE